VLLKSDLDVQQTGLRLLEHRSKAKLKQQCDQITTLVLMNLVTFCSAAKSDLDVLQTGHCIFFCFSIFSSCQACLKKLKLVVCSTPI
jgi:hypothetical protein